jgi:hypothetical protein
MPVVRFAKGYLTTEMDHAAIISIFDISGRKIFGATVRPGISTIDLGRLKNGNYCVMIENRSTRFLQRIAVME